MTGPLPLPKRVLHEGDVVLYLSVFNILCFPEGHSVAAYLFSLVFPSILAFYLSLTKMLQKVVTTQYVTNAVSFLFYFTLRYSFPQLLCNFIPTDLFYPSEVPNFKPFQLFLTYFPKCPSFSTIISYNPNVELYWFLP